ncbi:MAG: response regulator [Elusimicrobiota bacterium]
MALIMIADDDVDLVTALEDYLKSRNHQVVSVNDGVSASLKAQEWKPDLIIMDIMMPGVYGTSAYKSLESAGITKTTPVIFITSISPDQAEKLVPSGPRIRFLPKPVHFETLGKAITELLGHPSPPSQ